MDTESYKRILAVRAVRESWLTHKRALAAAEIHTLFRSCEQYTQYKEPRDTAMLAVIF